MKRNRIGSLALLLPLAAVGWSPQPQTPGAAAPSAPPAKVIAQWSNPQLLIRSLPHSPSVASLPSVAPDGRILLFTARPEQGEELQSYFFDPKSAAFGDSQKVSADQWMVMGDPRKLYVDGGWGAPIPVISPDGKKIVESLNTAKGELGGNLDPAYIFDRDATTGRIRYEIDAKTGRLSEKHRLVTRTDFQQVGLPPNTTPVWRNISFSPDSRFVYVPVKVANDLTNPWTRIMQKELNPKTGIYEAARLIQPPGGWNVRSGVGVSNDGAYYLASGYSDNPADGLYVLPTRFSNTPVRVRSYKDDEVIFYVPRNPETGDPAGPARVVRSLRALRAAHYYDSLPAGTYPWFCRAPVAVPNSNVWLFVVEVGGDHGGELQLLAATESYFQPQ
jgi:hypothetical protein